MKMRAFRGWAAAALGVAALVAIGSPATAHPRLVASVPERSSVLKKAPATVTVTFSEDIDEDASTFQLETAAKKVIDLKLAREQSNNPKEISVDLPKNLPAGPYVVRWKVVSEGHGGVPGLLRFEIKP